MSCLQKYAVVFYAGLSAITNASERITVKLLTSYLNAWQILMLRFLVQTPLCVILILLARDTFKPCVTELVPLSIKVIFFALSVVASYFALMYIDYTDEVVLNYGTLCLASILLSKWYLSEKISWFTLTMMIFILTGIIIVCQPAFMFNVDKVAGDFETNFRGYCWAIASGLLHSVSSCSNRKIVQTSAYTLTLYSTITAMVLGLFGSFCFSPSDFDIFNLKIIFLLLLGGVLGWISAIAWARGLQICNLADMCLVVQIDIPSGAVLQIIVFKSVPQLHLIIGGICIIAGITLLAIQEPLISKIRKWLFATDESVIPLCPISNTDLN